MGKQKIIIDTDIGTYYDDAFAVLYGVQSPEVDVLAVTTCYGDVDLRARIAKKILRVAGREDIPVCRGVGQPMDEYALMFGFEGENILTEEDMQDETLQASDTHAVDMIIEQVLKYPNEVTLITLGAVSNVAAAIIKEPKIVGKVKELIIMGGVIVPIVDEKGVTRSPIEEYNLNNDTKAAKIVFDSGMNITLVPIDVTLKVPLTPAQVHRINTTDTPIARLVSDILAVWPPQEKQIYLSVGIPTEHTGLWLHDPLTIAVAFDRSFITETRLHVALEFSQTLVPRDLLIRNDILRTIPKKLPFNMNVAIDVDHERFTEHFTSRICQSNLA
ncbi:nucleoside hydrolase [Paenibacillus xerothermodurans]|uniref:Nucleoside hydrolase n=1 Tax=Paenibacillus xerothermodurans TaxID=1977292 RepID=A0A2W1NDL9_PAEXE|nr:nucleoside hydrolase [Paenibacillus xerothermodurans]PZE22809.1 nucleoside hydrolase [Paenibacillus xerothermodurans]